MAALLQALGGGISARAILAFLTRKSPELAPKIAKALAGGITAEKIVQFFSKDKNFEKLKQSMEEEYPMENNSNPLVQAQNVRNQNMGSDMGSGLQRAAPGIVGAGAAAGLGMALNHALPNLLKTPMLGKEQKNQEIPQQPPIVPSAPTPSAPPVTPNQPNSQSNPSITQPANIQQPEENIAQEIQRKEALDAFKNKGKKKSILEEEKERFEKGYGKQPINDILPESTDSVEDKKSIAKNETVSSPQGIGEVKEIRGDKALIDVDGKLHKVNLDELEAPLFSDDEVADAYDNLMAKIPEEHRSGFISWAGYDEDRNVLGFIPRGGKYEELKDITPEEAQKIKEGKGVARTTGETREGLWVMGEDTRGGIISQIIHDRRKKHKAQEEKQGKFALDTAKPEKEDKGMKPLFDEMAHARNLSRERERKKKIQEKERLKKEKDEAKKRKKQA